ncbi:MAG: Bug family tripartite tricarboxylate transporter substrate binding protein [Bacteroidota bacterium]|jgi:tripartite-type tricarboxylate transporter receptor subunit TctC
MHRSATLLLSATLAMIGCGAAWAQSASAFPERPVRLVLAFGPGGLADITFRLVADKLTGILGKQVVVENQPGAGGVAAASTVMKAAPDGHTLLVLTNGTAISKGLFKSLPFDPVKDFAPVSLVAYFDLVIVANPESKYQSLGDLLAAARANPGKLNFGTINPGSTQNLSAELFKSTAGIDVAIVPFRTSPDAATALMAGNLDAVFESYTALRSLVAAKKLRPLATTGSKRSVYLPELPIVKEAGVPTYEVTGWNALGAPAGTPQEIVTLLNRHINTVVAMPDFKQRLLEFGNEAYAGTPDELRKQLVNDIAKWDAVIKKAGIPQQ